jgi:hypothetical protein
MVDRLKASVEQLEPPTCPNCSVEMKWYNSLLLREGEIGHYFHCPNCGRLKETRSLVAAVDGATGRPKLSRPAHHFECAA